MQYFNVNFCVIYRWFLRTEKVLNVIKADFHIYRGSYVSTVKVRAWQLMIVLAENCSCFWKKSADDEKHEELPSRGSILFCIFFLYWKWDFFIPIQLMKYLVTLHFPVGLINVALGTNRNSSYINHNTYIFLCNMLPLRIVWQSVNFPELIKSLQFGPNLHESMMAVVVVVVVVSFQGKLTRRGWFFIRCRCYFCSLYGTTTFVFAWFY